MASVKRIKAGILHYLVYKPRKVFRNYLNTLGNVSKFPPTEASILINSISGMRGLSSSYLEIGVENGLTFRHVKSQFKVAVDPKFLFNKWLKNRHTFLYETFSDSFFATIDESVKYDVIYLDGLHTYDQTKRDLVNSFKHAHKETFIIIDDTIPCDEFSSMPNQNLCYLERQSKTGKNDGSWHGDVYKVVCNLIMNDIKGMNIVTLVDLENPKTVIWLEKGSMWPERLKEFSDLELSSHSYRKCILDNRCNSQKMNTLDFYKIISLKLG